MNTTEINKETHSLRQADNNGVEAFHLLRNAAGADVPAGHSYAVMRGSEELERLDFQCGPVKEVGVNGITNEALLAILIHRTSVLNENFPSHLNEAAIKSMQVALNLFESRTRDRVARGVEGENKV